jgi:uncharacterized membrane protein YkoI
MLLLCSVAGAPLARDISQDEVRRRVQSGELRPFEQILQAALTRHPDATLLEVELDEDDGLILYELELLTRGVVRELTFDARSGALLEDELED